MINLLVMEVKPANAEVGRIVDDLEKLTQYRRDLVDQYGSPGNYYAAYVWVYGLPVERWPDLRARLLGACTSRPKVDRHLVSCFVHARPGDAAAQVAWQ